MRIFIVGNRAARGIAAGLCNDETKEIIGPTPNKNADYIFILQQFLLFQINAAPALFVHAPYLRPAYHLGWEGPRCIVGVPTLLSLGLAEIKTRFA